MTYNVFDGTLSLTQSISLYLEIVSRCFWNVSVSSQYQENLGRSWSW